MLGRCSAIGGGVREWREFGLWAVLGVLSFVVLGTAANSCRGSMFRDDLERGIWAAREQKDIRWCRSHGGAWMPIEGDRYVIYGCVFPPNGGER